VLATRDGCLELQARHHPGYGPIAVDWLAPEVRRRVAGGRRQLLARAAGLHRRPDLRILDATAGLGRDGFTLAALGARVTLTERNPTIAALLADGRRRALADPAAADAARRTDIVAADARDLVDSDWDAILLDPMYPAEGRSALSKKELQILRELAGDDGDAGEVLAAALRGRAARVAVKRPLKAPLLGGRAPAFQLKGTQSRFDIYRPARAEFPPRQAR
jgi:16S rRNA (guanine1516-N2)-methyltransferase